MSLFLGFNKHRRIEVIRLHYLTVVLHINMDNIVYIYNDTMNSNLAGSELVYNRSEWYNYFSTVYIPNVY